MKTYHKFMLKKGWIKISEIVENDKVLLYNNIRVKVKRIKLEKLEYPDITYNFEVENYHNYFVSKESVLVHNDCSGSYEIEFDDGKKYIGKGKEKRMEISASRIEKNMA